MSSFEELLKTAKGVNEAEAYLKKLKVEYIETENVLRMKKMVEEAKNDLNRSEIDKLKIQNIEREPRSKIIGNAHRQT